MKSRNYRVEWRRPKRSPRQRTYANFRRAERHARMLVGREGITHVEVRRFWGFGEWIQYIVYQHPGMECGKDGTRVSCGRRLAV